jgi:Pyridoxal-phosphate dependent enzyme
MAGLGTVPAPNDRRTVPVFVPCRYAVAAASDPEGMYLRPDARSLCEPSPRPAPEVRAFHARLPGYVPTPLVDVPALAAELGVRRVLVKDESRRIGLPAFKILGAGWAIARLLAVRGGLTGELSLDELRSAVARTPVSFVTATEGNHGRAVARIAALLGQWQALGLDHTATVVLLSTEAACVPPNQPGAYVSSLPASMRRQQKAATARERP